MPGRFMAEKIARMFVGFFVAIKELFQNLHRGINGFVCFFIGFLHGDRLAWNTNDSFKGLLMAVRAFLIDDKFSRCNVIEFA